MADVAVLAERISRALKGLADEHAVIAVESHRVMVKLARGEVSVVQSWRDINVAFYAARGGKMVSGSFKAESPEEALRETLRLADKLRPSKLYAPLPEPNGQPMDNIDPTAKEVAVSADSSKLIEELDLNGLGDASGMAEVWHSRRALVSSAGSTLESGHTGFNGYIRIFVDRVSGQWSWVSSRYDPELARDAIYTARSLAEDCSSLPRAQVESGRYRLLLSPMVAGNLFESVADAALAGNVILGMSFLSGRKPGDEVASDKVTLTSTPRDEGLPGFSGYDDEAVVTRDVAFIEHGVFKTLLHNTKTARLLGGETTGNAGLIFPRLFNLKLDPGSLKGLDDALDALGEGIFATNNWYTRFQNYVEGQFSTVLRDAVFTVKNGRPVGCVRGQRLRIQGTLPGLLKGVEDLGSKLYKIAWWEVETPFRLPYVLVSKDSGLKIRSGAIEGLDY